MCLNFWIQFFLPQVSSNYNGFSSLDQVYAVLRQLVVILYLYMRYQLERIINCNFKNVLDFRRRKIITNIGTVRQ